MHRGHELALALAMDKFEHERRLAQAHADAALREQRAASRARGEEREGKRIAQLHKEVEKLRHTLEEKENCRKELKQLADKRAITIEELKAQAKIGSGAAKHATSKLIRGPKIVESSSPPRANSVSRHATSASSKPSARAFAVLPDPPPMLPPAAAASAGTKRRRLPPMQGASEPSSMRGGEDDNEEEEEDEEEGGCGDVDTDGAVGEAAEGARRWRAATPSPHSRKKPAAAASKRIATTEATRRRYRDEEDETAEEVEGEEEEEEVEEYRESSRNKRRTAASGTTNTKRAAPRAAAPSAAASAAKPMALSRAQAKSTADSIRDSVERTPMLVSKAKAARRKPLGEIGHGSVAAQRGDGGDEEGEDVNGSGSKGTGGKRGAFSILAVTATTTSVTANNRRIGTAKANAKEQQAPAPDAVAVAAAEGGAEGGKKKRRKLLGGGNALGRLALGSVEVSEHEPVLTLQTNLFTDHLLHLAFFFAVLQPQGTSSLNPSFALPLELSPVKPGAAGRQPLGIAGGGGGAGLSVFR
ncbi:hypothetical protein K437DRAFT_143855 [Tilletiaria anomala UBC 951]|uniref:Uncharacterized protein n=1 Tax=Tilletiaria anomala (strain ATCC 24038 / CBS 436.72 / UBC 951) TaxID=1037660 RepID=A0A066VUK5_TILAU|nr:uncharacterized protein K437DRAFT_143855 [Tilletiaria anomala UBC 951]KDN43953.1 hypothetical protein K437DRAFT_143855 [Tilletiaria anomala UBC 951]